MGPTPRQTAGYREKWSNWANALEEPPARLRGGPHQGPQTRPGVWPHGKTHSALDVSRERRTLAEPPLVNLRLMPVDRADLRLPRMVPGAGPPRGSVSSRLCGNAPTSLGCHRARPLPPGGPLFGWPRRRQGVLPSPKQRVDDRDHHGAQEGARDDDVRCEAYVALPLVGKDREHGERGHCGLDDEGVRLRGRQRSEQGGIGGKDTDHGQGGDDELTHKGHHRVAIHPHARQATLL